jgi:hypothetical protein
MANGKLGSQDVGATTNTTVYNPSGVTGAITVSLCNRTSGAITIRLAVSATATPGADEWLEYGISVPANGVLERTGLVVGTGQYVVVYASVVGISAVALGYEDV